jgi:hypothetical protein
LVALLHPDAVLRLDTGGAGSKLVRGEAEVAGRATMSRAAWRPRSWPRCGSSPPRSSTDPRRWIAEVLGHWCEITRGELPDCWPLPEHWNANFAAAVDADPARRSQREANQA